MFEITNRAGGEGADGIEMSSENNIWFVKCKHKLQTAHGSHSWRRQLSGLLLLLLEEKTDKWKNKLYLFTFLKLHDLKWKAKIIFFSIS